MWLDHLKKLRKNGENRWRACCPVDNGSNPTSLSIKYCEDHSYIVHCFNCGANGIEVFEVLGLDLKELMGERVSQVKPVNNIYEQAFMAIAESEKKKGNYISLNDKRKVRLLKARQMKDNLK